MLDIQIDKDYKITNDNYNLILQHKRVVTGENTKGREVNPENIGKEVWDDEGYYRTLRGLLEGYCRIKVLKSNAKSFQELFAELKEIERVIKSIKDIDNLINLSSKDVKKEVKEVKKQKSQK